jgi:alkanesulfonate monooxygenase SsuD/methylene tetrahydromethanopterin reductase-like flavin-dependent oxidoreductase (luciferase family)
VTYQGEHWTLPLPDGPGKALRLTVHPVRDRIPIYLAAVGPRNLELAGELADGLLGIFFAPEHASVTLDRVRHGRSAAGLSMQDFDVAVTVPLVIGTDLEACAEPVRAYSALYLGGMGSRTQNFYNQLAVRMGFGAAAARVQDLFLDHKPREAAAAVPFEFVDTTALIGPVERIRDRLSAYADAGTTTLSVALMGGSLDERIASLRELVGAVEGAGLAEGGQ